MAHEKLYGVCENKCFVETMSKEQIENEFVPKIENEQIDYSNEDIILYTEIKDHKKHYFKFYCASGSGHYLKIYPYYNWNGVFQAKNNGDYIIRVIKTSSSSGEAQETIYHNAGNKQRESTTPTSVSLSTYALHLVEIQSWCQEWKDFEVQS